jgi:hypothetical protein
VLCERCGQYKATIIWITANGRVEAPSPDQAGAAKDPPPAPTICDVCAAEVVRDAIPGAPSFEAMARDAAEWAAFAEGLPADMSLEEKVRIYQRAQRGN